MKYLILTAMLFFVGCAALNPSRPTTQNEFKPRTYVYPGYAINKISPKTAKKKCGGRYACETAGGTQIWASWKHPGQLVEILFTKLNGRITLADRKTIMKRCDTWIDHAKAGGRGCYDWATDWIWLWKKTPGVVTHELCHKYYRDPGHTGPCSPKNQGMRW